MSDDIVRRTSAPVAANIRAAAEQYGKVEMDQVDWSVARYGVSSEVKRAIVFALTPDLYIEPAEERSILAVTENDEQLFVRALLGHLREQPPLLARARYLQSLLAKPSCSFLASLVRDCVTESDKKVWRREIQEKIAPVLARIKTK